MQNKLFIRNISYKLTEPELTDIFAEYGDVVSATIPKDRETGRSRGFAFVEMKTAEEAQAAITALNNRQVHGREIFVAVSESKPRVGGRR